MAYGDDWYLDCGREQLNQINAERAQELANLEAAKAAYDDHSAKAAIQAIADLDAKRANLSALYSQYVASQNPPRPPEPGAEERRARSWDRMDWQDIVDMTRQSKYARNIRPDDPGLIAGYHEAMRRRRAGE
jgi:hypothetical protein